MGYALDADQHADLDADAVIVPAQTRATALCSLVAGATAIDAVIFADRTLGEVLRGMPIDVIRIAAVSAFLLGTIVVSALLARQSGQRLLRARQGRGVPKYGTIPS